MAEPDEGTPDRRTAVLTSALETFARSGYRRTSMEEVARAARISRPGLYFLFASKEALFRDAVTQALERDLAAVETTLADAGRPLAGRLLDAFDAWAGRYAGPLTSDVTTLLEDHPDLLGPVAQTAPRRFAELVSSVTDVPGLSETLISTSIGVKHQVASREDYRARMAVAIDLLLR